MGFVAQLKHVDFGYNDRLILEDISLDIPKGKVVSVMGGSGSGKTTLLRLLAGDVQPTRGAVSVPAGGVCWVDLQNPAHDNTTVQACWDALRR